MSALHEWISFDGALPSGAADAEGVNHAPGRWLLDCEDGTLRNALLAAEVTGAGVLIDVRERWIELNCGPATLTEHPLNAAAPLGLVLRNRDNALLWVFDCPVLLLRSGQHVRVLVERSYAHSLRAMLARL